MKLVNLTEKRYQEFANSREKCNFGQTTEYARIITNQNKRKVFLGLINDDAEIQAAALILIQTSTKFIKEAYAPNGFLIDYADYELLETFTKLIKERLLKEGVTYLITNPMFKYKVLNKYNIPIADNENMYNNLIKLDFQSIGYFSEFENYDIIIEDFDNLEDIYNNFSRNTKRHIIEEQNMGISIHQGSIANLEEFYKIIKKKTKKRIEFYDSIMRTYNNKDNIVELYFSKINTHDYLIKRKKLFEKEKKENEKAHQKFNTHRGKITEHLMNYKMAADKTLEKSKNELDYAIKLNAKYNGDIIIGTCLIIRNNNEIYFLIDGYKEEFRHIYSSYIMKWALINKYYEMGYRTFNLGEIHNDYFNKTSKYYNQYKHKIGFGGNIVEYTPNLLFIINKPMYKIYEKLKNRH